MASWWNKWKKNEEGEQSVSNKLATLGTPCVIEKNKVDSSSQNLTSEIKKLDVYMQDSDNNTSLVVTVKSFDEKLKQAMIKENVDEIKYCIENGANINLMIDAMTLLYYAIQKNHMNFDLIEYLLQKGSNIELKNPNIDNITKRELNDVLIKKYEVREISNRYDKTPLNLILENNYKYLVKLFIKYNLTNKNLHEWLMKNKINNDNLIELIIENNKNNEGLLSQLLKLYPKNKILSNKFDEIYFKNCNIFEEGQTKLYKSILNQDILVIERLLLNGADVNKKNSFDSDFEHINKNSLDASIEIRNLEIIDLLIKYNTNKNTLIALSLEKNKLDIAKYIINKNNDFNIIDYNFISPLYQAILKEDLEIIELLLEKNANPNLINKNKSVLHIACSVQNLLIVKLLIKYAVNVNIQDNDGRIPLFNAIEATKANKDIIKYLIQNGADIYKKDNKGISPLSFAESSKKSMIKVLLESIPIELKIEKNFISYDKLISNDSKLYEQNKVINKLQKEIKNMIHPSKIDELNIIIETQSQNIQNSEKYLQLQLDEINNIKKEFKNNQNNQTQYIDELVQKIEKLEKENQKNKSAKKQKVSLNIPIQLENKTINQNDGVLVKRESFDDF